MKHLTIYTTVTGTTYASFDWSAIWPAIPLLLEGAKNDLWISVLGYYGWRLWLLDWRQVLPVRLAAGSPTTSFGFLLKLFAARAHRCRSHLPSLPCRWHLMICVLIRSAQRSVTIMINSGAYIAEVLAAQYYPFTKVFFMAKRAVWRWALLAGKPSAILTHRALRRMLPPLGGSGSLASRHLVVYCYRRSQY